jgi:hypothetical protein
MVVYKYFIARLHHIYSLFFKNYKFLVILNYEYLIIQSISLYLSHIA